MTQRKTYTAEFKRDAAGLAQSTEKIAGTARGLGLSALRKRIKAAQTSTTGSEPCLVRAVSS